MTADEYVRNVELALMDLPWGQRRALVVDLRSHLAELPADADLPSRLGDPERYAADLRAAEGLERRRGPLVYVRARRPRNVVLVTLLTVVLLTGLGLAIGALVWIDSYQPLGRAGGYHPPPSITRGFNGDTANVRDGRPFSLGIDITNDHQFTVRVLGAPFEPNWPWKARLFMSAPGPARGLEAPLAFHPVDLKPGQSMVLRLEGVWKCPGGRAPGDSDGALEDFPVRYTFLWNTATAHIRLPEPLELNYPDGCPPAKGGQ